MEKLNANQRVRVRLSDWGRKIYEREHGILPKEEDGWYEDQLWCIMRLFGPHIGMGCQPFDPRMEIIRHFKDKV